MVPRPGKRGSCCGRMNSELHEIAHILAAAQTEDEWEGVEQCMWNLYRGSVFYTSI